jgi:hypothetical protein
MVYVNQPPEHSMSGTDADYISERDRQINASWEEYVATHELPERDPLESELFGAAVRMILGGEVLYRDEAGELLKPSYRYIRRHLSPRPKLLGRTAQ